MSQAPKTDNNANMGRPKTTKRIRKRDYRVSQGEKRQMIPWPKRERVKQKFIAGKHQAEIAKEEGIHRTIVAKIVKEKDVAQHVQALREEFYGRLEEAMATAFDIVRGN